MLLARSFLWLLCLCFRCKYHREICVGYLSILNIHVSISVYDLVLYITYSSTYIPCIYSRLALWFFDLYTCVGFMLVKWRYGITYMLCHSGSMIPICFSPRLVIGGASSGGFSLLNFWNFPYMILAIRNFWVLPLKQLFWFFSSLSSLCEACWLVGQYFWWITFKPI